MNTTTQHIRNHLFKTCGCPEFSTDNVRKVAPNPAEILKTEWSIECEAKMHNRISKFLLQDPTGDKRQKYEQFNQLAKNRLVMGFLRYGSVQDKKGKAVYDRTSSVRKRLDLYANKETGGNAEHLVDIMNICMMMYIEADHPNFHWKAQDDAMHDEKN